MCIIVVRLVLTFFVVGLTLVLVLWGRCASFNLSSSFLSLIVGHLVSNSIAVAGLLLSGIAMPWIDVQHRNYLRPRRRRILSGLTKR
jgi:hypothetical protein